MQAAYRYKDKIPLIVKAGMGMQILDEINCSVEVFDKKLRLRIIAWNGITFNCFLDWAERGFAEIPYELAIELTTFTLTMFEKQT